MSIAGFRRPLPFLLSFSTWHPLCPSWTPFCSPSALFSPLPLPSSSPTYSTGAHTLTHVHPALGSNGTLHGESTAVPEHNTRGRGSTPLLAPVLLHKGGTVWKRIISCDACMHLLKYIKICHYFLLPTLSVLCLTLRSRPTEHPPTALTCVTLLRSAQTYGTPCSGERKLFEMWPGHRGGV